MFGSLSAVTMKSPAITSTTFAPESSHVTMNLTDSPASRRPLLQPHKCEREPEQMATTTTQTPTTLTTKIRPDVDFLLGGAQSAAAVDHQRKDKLTQRALHPNTPPVAPPRFVKGAHSRSQDDDDGGESRPQLDMDELLEQRFGSISPIFPDPVCSSRHSSLSPVGATRATNFRLKFRKSHTCGSLFANCSCSANTSATPIPIHSVVPAREAPTECRQPLAVLPSSMQLSLSPTSADVSASSGIGASLNSSSTAPSSSKWLSGGSFSLSTNTNTSVQLSRDDEDFDGLDDASNNAGPTSVGEKYVNRAHASSEDASRSSKSPRISSPSTLEVPSVSYSSSLPRVSSSSQKPKRLFQSYSHPDTDFIFTDENKKPSRDVIVLTHQQNTALADAVITSRDGKVAYRHPKRSSSPNIGEYQTLDIAVHPDLLVKISPRHSPSRLEQHKLNPTAVAAITPPTVPTSTGRSTQQRRRCLQRSKEIKSGGSTSDSEPSYDVQSSNTLNQTQGRNTATCLSSPSTAEFTNKPTKEETESLNAAQRYFAESGILGPINPSSDLIRKTSKILQDSNVIEKIRKTSLILRANLAAANQRKNSKESSTNSGTSTTTIKTTRTLPSLSPTPQPPSPTTLHSYNTATMELPAKGIYAQPSKAPKSPPPKSPRTIGTTCGFSPNLTTQRIANTDDRDALIKSLQGEMLSLKDVIKSRDAEIMKLRREIHKLKSVLQQTTNHIPIAHDELLQSPTENKPRFQLPNQCLDVSSSSSTVGGSRRLETATCIFCHRKFDMDAHRADSNDSASLDSNLSEFLTCTSAESITDNNTSRPNSKHNSDSNSDSSSNNNNNVNSTTPPNTNSASCALVASENGPPHGAVDASATNATLKDAASESLSCSTMAKSKLLQIAAAPVLKKQGVSGESCETSMQLSINDPIPKFDKDFSSKQLIKDAIMDNDFLKNIDVSQVRELVESMYSLSASKGESVIREGEVGAHLYVSAAGQFEVVKNGKVLGIMGPGKAFGELAILYNCTRTASVRVLSDARVWVLDRRVFQQIMMRTGMQRIENSVNFLKSVPLLKNLSEEVLAKIADVLEVEFYPAGTYIIRQGASGDTFFLISQGSVQVTQKFGVTCVENEIRTLERGDYFGEQALINEDKRTANIIALAPGVECLTLDRESFTHLIGDLCELKEKNYDDENRMLAMKHAETKEVFGAHVNHEFPDMKLTDLEVVATLGIGGFGRVELVKAYQENRVDTFALKCLKKRHIVDTKQEEHVFSERTIMMTCNTPFICRLHRTFRDEKYVYMLLEACMGGEIWTMLRDRGCFEESATQFIIGCVLQAFEYLHSRGIIYRDLKPENLMMDERGYVKLVDFGFAKYIGNSSKTWTFCGTPEYVAPEIILNKGHDRAVDYWALGILIHELLNGTPPFTSNDPMKTYNIILKGIDMIDFPKHMTRSAVQLIKKLCRDVPTERLGYQKGGIQDIKKHKWFLGFDWDGLQSQLLISPFVRPIAHPTDTCYFDRFPCDSVQPPDELSGWDADF